MQVWRDGPGRPGLVNGQLPQQPGSAAVATSSPVLLWRKSSHSGRSGNCVEIAWRLGAGSINIMVRDSKFPAREPLMFTPGEWAVFLDRVKGGEFDVLAAPPAVAEEQAEDRPSAPVLSRLIW